MTQSYLDLFESELDSIPTQMRRFLRTRKDAPSSEQSWGYFAYGFSAGFQHLLSAARTAQSGQQYLRLPVLCLCRHSVELNLKRANAECSAYTGSDIALSGHDILNLWRQLVDQIEARGFPTDDDWSRHCGQLVAHLYEFDPSGERFRYPAGKNGVPFPITEVEFDELVRAHWHITEFCDATVMMFEASTLE